MIILALALACAPDTTHAPDVDTTSHPVFLVDCDEQEYNDGLTLVDLPLDSTVAVTVVDGNEVYTETIRVDNCGTATPFTDMAVDDFGGLNELSSVYANVVEDTGYYVYQGVFLTAEPNAPPETPISTQWAWSEDAGDWVAIRDPELGILIGLFMIP